MNNENNHNDPSTGTGTENEDLKREAPLLFGISKKEPFEAPKGYFEQFLVNVSDAIQHEKATSWYTFLFRKVVYIPSFVVLLVVGFYFLKPTPTAPTFVMEAPTQEYSLDNISYDLLNEYVENHLLASLNTNEIVDIVGHNEIPDLGIETPINNVQPSIDHIEVEEMEDYILDNIDDFDINEVY